MALATGNTARIEINAQRLTRNMPTWSLRFIRSSLSNIITSLLYLFCLLRLSNISRETAYVSQCVIMERLFLL